MVVMLVLAGFALVGWVVAGQVVERLASVGSRIEETALAGPEPAPVVLLAPPVAVPRPVRRCGNCRAAGHTRPACPRLTGALPLPHL